MGAPWVTGFDRAEEIAAIAGGRVVEDVSSEALQEQHRPDDRSLAGYDFYRVAEIETIP